MLDVARNVLAVLLETDPDLESAGNLRLKNFLKQPKQTVAWSKIS
jgi:hypothetical protein